MCVVIPSPVKNVPFKISRKNLLKLLLSDRCFFAFSWRVFFNFRFDKSRAFCAFSAATLVASSAVFFAIPELLYE